MLKHLSLVNKGHDQLKSKKDPTYNQLQIITCCLCPGTIAGATTTYIGNYRSFSKPNIHLTQLQMLFRTMYRHNQTV